MFNKPTIASAMIIAFAFGVPATSMAKTSTTNAACALHAHRVTKVTPYRAQLFVGRGTVLRGASLFVPAERGLTAEWLETEFRKHLAAMQSQDMANCPLDVTKVKVEVVSGGSGFWVRLIAPDIATSKEVLRRAELMLG